MPPLRHDPPSPRAAHRPRTHRFGLDFVLGTTLDLSVAAPPRRAAQARDAVLAEIARLEAVFSRFLPDSDLSRSLRGDGVDPGSDLFPLLRDAAAWTARTGGAFHPGAQLWCWWP